MNIFAVSAVILTLSAFGSYFNRKWLKLPNSISLLIFSMLLSLAGLILKQLNFYSFDIIQIFLSKLDFKEIIFHGMLSFLLFAGSMQINFEDLKKSKIAIVVTAIISTLISTFFIGIAFYYTANYLKINITWLEAMLFGSILSPTDPIAVLSVIKKMKIPKIIETTIIGESLFNDCIAIVIFLMILELSTPGKQIDSLSIILFILQEIGGGFLFGGFVGMLACKMLSSINDFDTHLLITLSVATGGYAIAEKLGFSAPLAMVIAGLILGNRKKTLHGASQQIRQYLDLFWEAIDNVLNTSLFILIGMEMLVITTTIHLTLLSFACIPIALISRYVSIAFPLNIIKPFHIEPKGTSFILTWGGLRGALSIAMVLSLPSELLRVTFLPCIYYVVIFSIIIQGLTFNRILRTHLKSLKNNKLFK